jgi:hypothetical protein
VTDPGRLRHRARAPMRLARRRSLQRLYDDRFDIRIGNAPRRPDARLVIQPLQPPLDELASPLRHRRLGGPQPLSDRAVWRVDARQDNPRAKRHRSIHARPFRQADQLRVLVVGDHDLGSGASHRRHALLAHTSGTSPRDFASGRLVGRHPIFRLRAPTKSVPSFWGDHGRR